MWQGIGDWTELQYIDPPLLWPSALCLYRSLDAQPEARGPTLLAFSSASYHQLVWSPNSIEGPEGPFCRVVVFPTTSCLQLVWSSTQLGVPKAPSAGWWLSLPHLLSNSSDLQLTDFLSSPSYIIAQSPTQSLQWHVWSSSSGNNCHAVHRSLSSSESVYECTMEFLPCPIFSAKPAYAISSHNCHWNVSLPSSASLWNGMFGRVKGQYTTISYEERMRMFKLLCQYYHWSCGNIIEVSKHSHGF